MRARGRVDSNQTAIVEGVRQIGGAVQSLAPLGNGVPDLLVAFRGAWYVIEVKDGSKARSRRKLTADEMSWHERFGSHAPVYVANSLADVLAIIGAT